ncbi:MAG TPA: alpha/beta fold hydrolase [Pyrinomonadaceae bacterium]|nr:alpha/beta fold hydrolase [Pyrinomonadaceae bacterium]
MYPKGNLFIPAPWGRLEAILKDASGKKNGSALVCHPLPQGGGTMHNKVVYRAAAGLNDAGFSTLRFNFRGVGLSSGQHGNLEQGIEDAALALDFLKQLFPEDGLIVAGFSFGSRTGLFAAKDDPQVKALISIGSPVDKYGEYDFLAGVNKPILFIHGKNDEYGNWQTVEKMADELAKTQKVDLVLFENCGHFFDNHLEELKRTVAEWAKSIFS